MWLLKEEKKKISYSQIIDTQQINIKHIKFNGKFMTKISVDIISSYMTLFLI